MAACLPLLSRTPKPGGGGIKSRSPLRLVPSPKTPTPVKVLAAPRVATQVYGCVYSGLQYQGCCPVTRCPANIRADRHESGCLHNCFPGKELGVQELAFGLGLDPAVLREKYDVGIDSLRRLLLFQRFLDWTRVRTVPLAERCSCGIPYGRCQPGKCRNAKRVAKVLGRYPFCVEPLEVTAADLGRLLFWRHELERTFKTDPLEVTGLSEACVARLLGL